MADTIAVHVLYFASLREQRGQNGEQIEVEYGVTALQLWERLYKLHGLHTDRVMCTVNREYLPNTRVLQEGDEVAFFPPVTGG
ncbi:MAG: molybdopterin converting factor subunit 1 [Candidatus Eutrophobiaceae bacterium]